MKYLAIVATILIGLASSVGARMPGSGRSFGKTELPRHNPSDIIKKRAAMANSTRSAAQPTVATRMKVWQLGAYPAGNWSRVNDINDFGMLIGWSNLSGADLQHPVDVPLFGPHALQWSDLGTLGGEGVAEAFGISDTGIIVGHAINASGYDRAFVWTSATGMVQLETFPGEEVSEAFDINRIGTVIVGWSAATPDSWALPAYWTPTFE